MQLVYKSLPESSLDSKVLSYLLDRDALSAARAKEQTVEALVAWFAADALRLELADLDGEEYRRALTGAIALLKGRAAYCQSLLESSTFTSGGSPGLQGHQQDMSPAAGTGEGGGSVPSPAVTPSMAAPLPADLSTASGLDDPSEAFSKFF